MAAWTMVAAALAAAAAEPPTEQTHPHLEDMIQRVFPTNDATIQAEKEMVDKDFIKLDTWPLPLTEQMALAKRLVAKPNT